MPKYSKNPCNQVVSFRITEQERTFLNRLATHYDKSVSETMREILILVNDSAGQLAHR